MRNPALTAWLVGPDGLATRMRSLRLSAGLTGAELADRVGQGWDKTKVSKIENGRQMPTVDSVRRWAEACASDAVTTEELLAIAGESTVLHASWSARLAAGGQEANQRAYNQILTRATTACFWETSIIPGLLQTSAVARVMLAESIRFHGKGHPDSNDLDAAVARRIERASLLYRGTPTVELLLTEAALRYEVAPPAVMVAQCDRIRAALDLPGVRIGIVPLHRPIAHFLRPSFEIYRFEDGSAIAMADLPGGVTVVEQPGAVEVYVRLFTQTWEDALEGAEAAGLLDNISSAHLDR